MWVKAELIKRQIDLQVHQLLTGLVSRPRQLQGLRVDLRLSWIFLIRRQLRLKHDLRRLKFRQCTFSWFMRMMIQITIRICKLVKVLVIFGQVQQVSQFFILWIKLELPLKWYNMICMLIITNDNPPISFIYDFVNFITRQTTVAVWNKFHFSRPGRYDS